MKHTPGPWVAQERSNSMIDIHHSFGNVKGAITLSLCRVQSRESWIDESKANAALIAAAPELLEALKLALKALDAIGDEMTVGERYTNAGQYLLDSLNPARAAIAKATGESA